MGSNLSASPSMDCTVCFKSKNRSPNLDPEDFLLKVVYDPFGVKFYKSVRLVSGGKGYLGLVWAWVGFFAYGHTIEMSFEEVNFCIFVRFNLSISFNSTDSALCIWSKKSLPTPMLNG